MIQPSLSKCTLVPNRLRRLALIATFCGFCLLSACSGDPDRLPHWLTGEPDLPPARPEIADYRNAPSLPLQAIPERPFPAVDVEQRQQMRTDLASESAAATAAAAPIRQDMAADGPQPPVQSRPQTSPPPPASQEPAPAP